MSHFVELIEEFSMNTDDLDHVADEIDKKVNAIESRGGKIIDIQTEPKTKFQVRIYFSS